MTASAVGIAGYRQPPGDRLRFVIEQLRTAGGAGKLTGRHRPNDFMLSCPGPRHHRGDVNPSLNVGYGRDGRKVVVNCFFGCDTGELLRLAGLTMRDLFPNDDEWRPSARRSRSQRTSSSRNRVAIAPVQRIDGALRGLPTEDSPAWVHDLWQRDGPTILAQPGRVVVSQVEHDAYATVQPRSERVNPVGASDVEPGTSDESCQQVTGVLLRRKGTTEGRYGIWRCRKRRCPVHGAGNTRETVDHWLNMFGGARVYRLAVTSRREWDARRKQLERLRSSNGLGHGYKIPTGVESWVVFTNAPIGEPVEDPAAAFTIALSQQPKDAGNIAPFGGWKTSPPKRGNKEWEVEAVTEMPRMKLFARLHSAGLAPTDLTDEERDAAGLVDGFSFTMPHRSDREAWESFIRASGAIDPGEFVARRRYRRAKQERKLAA